MHSIIVIEIGSKHLTVFFIIFWMFPSIYLKKAQNPESPTVHVRRAVSYLLNVEQIKIAIVAIAEFCPPHTDLKFIISTPNIVLYKLIPNLLSQLQNCLRLTSFY